MTNKETKSSKIMAPISIGEIIDKITILEIKEQHLQGKSLTNVKLELLELNKIVKVNKIELDEKFLLQLKEINLNLWEIEDNIRLKESRKEFDNEFIELARSVYTQNDQRANIKKQINYQYNSELIEEKSYKKY
tara:strand:+ start:1308 stop:1709 length:402 start_codon:yes stop_codon:yes gene_type:complete